MQDRKTLPTERSVKMPSRAVLICREERLKRKNLPMVKNKAFLMSKDDQSQLPQGTPKRHIGFVAASSNGHVG